MKKFAFIILSAIQLTAFAQCTETLTLGTTGSNCLGTAYLNATGVNAGTSNIAWYKNDLLVYSDNTSYTAGSTIAGGNGQGSAANQFSSPWGVFVDAAGNVYVADGINNRIQKFLPGSATGITVAGGNGSGAAANQLYFPTCIRLDKNGNIFICDYLNNRIQKWAPGAVSGVTVAGGNGLGAGANQLYYPESFFIDSVGTIYIADQNNNRIQKWVPGADTGITVAGGHGYGNAANQLAQPHGVAVDAAGNIYTTDNNPKIKKWAPGASSSVTIAGSDIAGSAPNQFIRLSYVFLDKQENLYIVDAGDNRSIKRLKHGETNTKILAGGNGSGSAPNQFSYPGGIYVDSIGVIFVCDVDNHRIQKWDPHTIVPSAVPAAGNYKAIVTTVNGCTYTSNTANVFPSGEAKATISSNAYSAVCNGDSVRLAVFINKDGLAPTYQWAKNNIDIGGAAAEYYVSSNITDGDIFNCRVSCNARGCLTNDIVTSNSEEIHVAPVYTFTGNGNWDVASNWANNKIPPTVLPSCSRIIIDPITNGECILNKQQLILEGGSITVMQGKKFKIVNNLLIDNNPLLPITNSLFTDTAKRGHGFLPSTNEELKAIPYVERINTSQIPLFARPASLPPAFSLDVPPPGDQGDLGSCTAWVVGYGLYGYIDNIIEKNIKQDGKPDYDGADKKVSPWFIYNQLNGGQDLGITFSAALNLVKNMGACKWVDMWDDSPNFLVQPTPDAIANARDYKSTRFQFSRFAYFSVNELKELLVNAGFPIPFGGKTDDSFETGTGNGIFVKPDGRKVWMAYSDQHRYNHAMLICGYDDNINAFKILNSWGTGKGNGGYYWIDYDFLSQLVARTDYTLEPHIYFVYTQKPNITITTNQVINLAANSAKVRGNIVSNAGEPVTERGICYSKNFNPTTSSILTTNITVTSGNGPGNFITDLVSLEPNTKYYYRAYAKTPQGIVYGNNNNFTTVPQPDNPVVTIGSQVWTTQNLDVTTYRNGDIIPEVRDSTQWANLTTGAWCYNYNGQGTNIGKLYNWYAVNDPRGLAPVGWHVATYSELTTLMNHLGGPVFAGTKMKAVTNLWLCHYPEENADNSSGFTGLPGGVRGADGQFEWDSYSAIVDTANNINNGIRNPAGTWWTSTPVDGSSAVYYELHCGSGELGYYGCCDGGYRSGKSVRCVKDP